MIIKLIFSLCIYLSLFPAFPSDVGIQEQIRAQSIISYSKNYIHRLEAESGYIKQISDNEIEIILHRTFEDILKNVQNHEHRNFMSKLLNGIKDEATHLARKEGLGIALAFVIVEIAEWPLKAMAIASGNPGLAIAMEVGRIEIVIPLIMKSFSDLIKRRKVINLVGKENFVLHRQGHRSMSRDGQRRSDGWINLSDETIRVRPHVGILNTLSGVGLLKSRLTFGNLKRFLKKTNLNDEQITQLLGRKDLNKSEKVVVTLFLISQKHPETFQTLIHKYQMKSDFVIHENTQTFNEFDWSLGMLLVTSLEEVKDGFCSLDISDSHPFVILSLWEDLIYPHIIHHWGSRNFKNFKMLRKKQPLIKSEAISSLFNFDASNVWGNGWCERFSEHLNL